MFIVFEGIDMSGKTTTQDMFVKILEDLGYKVCVTREPGGGVIGEQVRKILVSNPIDDDVWGLLLGATRIEHGREVIKPALERNEIVVSSRYITSTYVYQPKALPGLKALRKLYPDIVEPDFMVLCDCPVDVILERKKKRQKENPDDMDFMDDKFEPMFKEQRQKFLDMANKLGDMACVLNTNQPLHMVRSNLISLVQHLGLIK